MSNAPAPGWYPDPTGLGYDRWWDGNNWTESTSVDPSGVATQTTTPNAAPSEADWGHIAAKPGDSFATMRNAAVRSRAPTSPAIAVPKRARRGTAVVVTMVALLLGGLIGVVVSTNDNESVVERDDGRADEAQGAAPPEEAGDDAAGNDADATLEDSTQGTVDTSDVGRSEQPATRVVDVDGACTAEVDAAMTMDDLRAWQLPECEWAPIDPNRDGEWIVVVLSLNGNDFGAAEAWQRAREVGLPGRVLWSSHYASLNPDLWVVYEGPFSSEAAASRAAAPGTYPRMLSDDTVDRYCAAADGCLGERAG